MISGEVQEQKLAGLEPGIKWRGNSPGAERGLGLADGTDLLYSAGCHHCKSRYQNEEAPYAYNRSRRFGRAHRSRVGTASARCVRWYGLIRAALVVAQPVPGLAGLVAGPVTRAPRRIRQSPRPGRHE